MVEPKITIIISCYNYGRYLDQSISSVFQQSYENKEVIIVDDGSTDDTKERTQKAKEFYGSERIKYIYQVNTGVSSARNTGLGAATGRYVIFLDADDLWKSGLLEKEIELIESNKDLGMVYCWYEYLDDADGTVYPASGTMINPSARSFYELLLENSCAASSVLVKTELIKQIGGFSTRYSNAADWHMWLRIAAASRFDVIEQPLVYVRRHPFSMSGDKLSMNEERLQIINELSQRHPVKSHIPPRQWNAYRAQMQYNVVVGNILKRRWRNARLHILCAIGIRPLWWRLWFQLVRCTIQPIVK